MKKLFLMVLMAVLSFGIAAVAVAGGKGEAGPQGELGTGPIPVAKLAEMAAKEGLCRLGMTKVSKGYLEA